MLSCFYRWQYDLEKQKLMTGSLLVGYALETGLDSFTIATDAALQMQAGAISRGAFLFAMARPDTAVQLRVRADADTPLAGQERQTAYELAKRTMPPLDAMTASDLAWKCYRCDVVGTFYEKEDQICFAGDQVEILEPSAYRIYHPGPVLPLVVNGEYVQQGVDGVFRATEYTGEPAVLVPPSAYRQIGFYRPTELYRPMQFSPSVYLYLRDIRGHRTALFGKTRSGKSNTIKMIASSMLDSNRELQSTGQLVIDVNGEYANDNPQDGMCMLSRYPDQCVCYAIHPRNGSGARQLRSNFYLDPPQAMKVFGDVLRDNASNYIRAFLSAPLPSLEEIRTMGPGGERLRAVRRVQIFWAILYKAGFQGDETQLETLGEKISGSVFNPGFRTELKQAMGSNTEPDTLQGLYDQLALFYQFYQDNPQSELLKTAHGALLETDDLNLLQFLFPGSNGSGPKVLSGCRSFHSSRAGNVLEEIPKFLDDCKTVILDLSNGAPTLVRYMTDQICTKVFRHQEQRFTENALRDHYVQIYAEEAHNYFPAKDTEQSIYLRIAKEGAKYHIGLVYATQSPSTISGELLSQTENFFVAHLDSSYETDALVRRADPFAGVKESILKTRTPGYVHMLTASQRYPISVQIDNFRDKGVR